MWAIQRTIIVTFSVSIGPPWKINHVLCCPSAFKNNMVLWWNCSLWDFHRILFSFFNLRIQKSWQVNEFLVKMSKAAVLTTNQLLHTQISMNSAVEAKNQQQHEFTSLWRCWSQKIMLGEVRGFCNYRQFKGSLLGHAHILNFWISHNLIFFTQGTL